MKRNKFANSRKSRGFSFESHESKYALKNTRQVSGDSAPRSEAKSHPQAQICGDSFNILKAESDSYLLSLPNGSTALVDQRIAEAVTS